MTINNNNVTYIYIHIKRKLHHILMMFILLLLSLLLLLSFEEIETALTVVYTINRCPSPIVQNQTPYDLLFGSSPSYDLLKVFGCICFVIFQDIERIKLQF